jgi:hypothetical protein
VAPKRSPRQEDAALRSPEAADALKALVELGFDHRLAQQRLQEACAAHLAGGSREPPTVEELVRVCLLG